MCNLTTQWAVPSNGPLNAGSVREINSRVSPSKNMINTPPGDAAEDEVGAAGSGSVGTQGEVCVGGGQGGERSGAERAKSRTHWQLGEKGGKARAIWATIGTGTPTSSPLPVNAASFLFCILFFLFFFSVMVFTT